MNDTFTAAAGTFNNSDVIIDQSSTDSDVLNLTLNAADINVPPSGRVSGVESINVSIDAFSGTANTLNAANVTGATITLGSSKLGFDGVAGVSNADANNVTAGSNITDLTVAGLTTGTVNTGAATTASVTTAGASDVANVTVNGDVNLTISTATEAKVTATADSKIELTTSSATKLTVAGTGNTTIAADDMLGNEIVNGKTSGDLTAIASVNGDVTKWAVDSIQVEGNVALTGVGAAPVELTTKGQSTSLAGVDATKSNVVVSTSVDQTSLTVTGAKSAQVDVTAAATIGTLNVGAIGTTIDVAGATTVTTLTSTGAVALTGTGDVTVTNGTTATSLDASALTGKLVATSDAAATILGGSGDNAITVSDHNTSYIGQAGNDVLTAAALSAGVTLAAQLGAGDDTLQFNAASAAGTLNVDFGAGNDTLALGNGVDLSAAKVTFTGLETIKLADAATVTATLDASTLSGQSYAITDAKASNNVTVSVVGDQATIDLGKLALTNVDSVVIDAKAGTASTITGTSTADIITGSTAADTINGGAGDDTITGNGGADVLTGGAGADTFVFQAGDSTASAMASITDFSIAQFDKLDLASNTVTGAVADVDVSGAIANPAGGEVVTASVANGIVTLAGADASAIDTLAEWVNVIDTAGVIANGDVAAFAFNGNTYVAETNATTGNIDNIIQLTGVTGLDAVANAAGVNTLVIA